LIFFVYPDPKGSEEPSPDFSGRARRSQNQFTSLGDGVNKLIFERWVRIFSVYRIIAFIVIKLEVPII
jgi:hypothetical protein